MHVPRILLFGAHGQLGVELARTLSLLGQVVAADQPHCDICDETALRAYIRIVKPALIVNAAAYTAVDKAESEPELAERVNAIAPGIMAQEAQRLNAGMVHYSTDYVYDGKSNEPYREDHPTAPLSVYGLTKLHGDQAIQASGCRHLIFRTTWVYGHHGNNFVKTILRLASTRDELKIVDDQFGAPTWSRAIATATTIALAQLVPLVQLGRDAETERWTDASGVYHLSAGGRTNWLEFATDIVARGKAAGVIPEKTLELKATTGLEYGAPALRPTHSVLSNGKVQAQFGIYLPDWRVSFEQMFNEHPAGLIS